MLLTALIMSLVVSASAPQKYDAQLEGPVNEEALTQTYTELKTAYDADKSEATLYINSPGGDAMAMLQFLSHVEDLKKYGMKIHCTADVEAASAASIIFEDICDIRDVTPSTVILFHEAAAIASGKETSVEDGLAFLKAIDRIVAFKIAPRLGISLEEYRDKVRGRDWWIDADEAIKLHAADRLVSHRDCPTRIGPPEVQNKKRNEAKLPPPFDPKPAPVPEPEHDHDSIAAPVRHLQPSLFQGGHKLLDKLSVWCAQVDVRKTAGLILIVLGGVILAALISGVFDKRKAKKIWTAKKLSARLAAEDAARQVQIQAILDSVKAKTKKVKKSKKSKKKNGKI